MMLPHMHTDRHTQTLAPPTNIHKNTYETHINTLIGTDINMHSTQICTNTDTQV